MSLTENEPTKAKTLGMRLCTWVAFWFQDWQYLAMPAFALGWFFSGAMLRITRSSMLEVIGSDYIKLVRLKGIPEWVVTVKHALKNSLIPILTLAGLNLLVGLSAIAWSQRTGGFPARSRPDASDRQVGSRVDTATQSALTERTSPVTCAAAIVPSTCARIELAKLTRSALAVSCMASAPATPKTMGIARLPGVVRGM